MQNTLAAAQRRDDDLSERRARVRDTLLSQVEAEIHTLFPGQKLPRSWSEFHFPPQGAHRRTDSVVQSFREKTEVLAKAIEILEGLRPGAAASAAAEDLQASPHIANIARLRAKIAQNPEDSCENFSSWFGIFLSTVEEVMVARDPGCSFQREVVAISAASLARWDALHGIAQQTSEEGIQSIVDASADDSSLQLLGTACQQILRVQKVGASSQQEEDIPRHFSLTTAPPQESASPPLLNFMSLTHGCGREVTPPLSAGSEASGADMEPEWGTDSSDDNDWSSSPTFG